MYESAFRVLAGPEVDTAQQADVLPIFLFFFLAKLSNSVDSRRNFINELMGEDEIPGGEGILPFLVQEGVNPRTELERPCISY